MRFIIITSLLLLGCKKTPSLGQIQKDGYGCSKAGMKGGFVPQAGNHCFECPDDDSMQKCGANPLTSGCKEVTCAVPKDDQK
jgi:hypothetical protein